MSDFNNFRHPGIPPSVQHAHHQQLPEPPVIPSPYFNLFGTPSGLRSQNVHQRGHGGRQIRAQIPQIPQSPRHPLQSQFLNNNQFSDIEFNATPPPQFPPDNNLFTPVNFQSQRSFHININGLTTPPPSPDPNYFPMNNDENNNFSDIDIVSSGNIHFNPNSQQNIFHGGDIGPSASSSQNQRDTPFSQIDVISQNTINPSPSQDRRIQLFGRTPSNPNGTRRNATTRTTTTGSSRRGSYLIAIAEGRGHARGDVGMACYHLETSHLILCQFSDTQTYAKTITKINIFPPTEILMCITSCAPGKESQLVNQIKSEFPEIPIVSLVRRVFNESKGIERLKELAAEPYQERVKQLCNKYYAMAASFAVIRYVEVTHSNEFPAKCLKIDFQSSENTTLIDTTTTRHLELVQNTQNPSSKASLFGTLNTCRTPGGIKLLRMNILQPSFDQELIDTRLSVIEEFIDKSDIFFAIKGFLSNLNLDLDNVIGGLIRIPAINTDKILEQRINNVIAVKHTLTILPQLAEILQNADNEYLASIHADIAKPIYHQMLQKIDEVISEDARSQRGLLNMRTQRIFAVKSEMNPILDLARKAYIQIKEEVNRYIGGLCGEYNLPIRLIENSTRGNYLQFIIRKGNPMPQNLPPTFLRVNKRGNVVNFITEYILMNDQRLAQVTREIEMLSDQLICILISTIRADIGSLYKVSEAIANLDMLIAFGNYAMISRGVRPQFSKKITSIVAGRHPVLDSVDNTHTPNNAHLTRECNFMLITGPNMSGKTTYLKQIACLQILAQIGCYVPAVAAIFRPCSSIFSRIGMGDNVEDDASTFGLEMMEANYILKNLGKDSLVIIDELGRATAQEEGTAISWAIAEVLIKSSAFLLFATHYIYLTKLESLYPNCYNFKMKVAEIGTTLDTAALKFTHILKRGVTEVENYGLKLAINTSFPRHNLEDATAIAEQIGAQKISSDEMEQKPTKRDLYNLGCHLKLMNRIVDANNLDSVRMIADYLVAFQDEFKKNKC